MENSNSVLNKYVIETQIKSLIHSKSSVIQLLIFFTSIIFILSSFLIRYEDKSLSYSSYSSVMLSTIMIFTLSISYIPLYLSSTYTKYSFIFAFILQIINIVLYGELLKDTKNNALLISIIILQVLVVFSVQYEFFR